MRDAALVEWGEVMTELAAIREARGKEILPNRVQGSIGARVIPTL